MKVSIRLEYRDKVYNSSIETLTEKELKELKSLVAAVVNNEAEALSFQNNNKVYHFCRKILIESIITIIYHE